MSTHTCTLYTANRTPMSSRPENSVINRLSIPQSSSGHHRSQLLHLCRMGVTLIDSTVFPSIRSFLSTTCLRSDFAATTVENLLANEVRPAFNTWLAVRQAWREAQMIFQGEIDNEQAQRDEEKARIDEKAASVGCRDQIVRHMGTLAVSNER